MKLSNHKKQIQSSPMQKYFEKSPKLIEDFMIIGASKQEFAELQPQKDVSLPAKMLYCHSGNDDCQRRKVVKDFCFPSQTD